MGEGAEGKMAQCPALQNRQEAMKVLRGKERSPGNNHGEDLLLETVTVMLHTHTHPSLSLSLSLCLPSLCPPQLSKARGLSVPRGYGGHAVREPRSPEQIVRAGPKPNTGEVEKTDHSAESLGLEPSV